MDKSIAFVLVSKTRTQDELKQWVETLVERPVFGQMTSVSAQEFFAGGQNGFKPEYRIVMFGPDYQGEDEAVIDGVHFTIYRTYRGRFDQIELYLERRVGNNGKSNG